MNFQNFIFLKFNFSEQRRHGMEVYSSLDLVKKSTLFVSVNNYYIKYFLNLSFHFKGFVE
jgi:hypothetical protein